MNVLTFNAVDDDIFTHGDATRPSTEIFIAGSSNIGEAGQKKEPAGDRVNQAGGNIHAAAFFGDVKPNVIKIGFGLWRYTVRHLAGVGQFNNQAGASAVPHLRGKFPHGLLRDDAAFAAGKGSAGVIEGCQQLDSPAFAFFPQRKRFLYRLFLAVQPPGFNGATGECFLIWRKLIFHCGGSSSHPTPNRH
ncbi:MAG TPA: hypothetical protein VNY05_33870 [Candidatus Acidoferrales bacterium]|nr:hypothetical protein [Candidatus Acidoferrales bacterium]